MSQPIPLPPFKAFLASNIPSVYDNTLSYYDELTKLIAYLEGQVVPAVNANTEGLATLKDYVEHYFDNLNVQEEINNKLDEMTENGTLEEIIGHYITENYVTKDDIATAETAGIVKIGDGISVTADGTISETPFEQFINADTLSYEYTAGDTHTFIKYAIIPAEYKPKIVMADPEDPDVRKIASDVDAGAKPSFLICGGGFNTQDSYTYGPLIIDGDIKIVNNLDGGTDTVRTIMGISADGLLTSINGGTAADAITLPNACRTWQTIYNQGITEYGDGGRNPRTFIAQDSANNYIIGVCGGRTASDTGMTLQDIINFIRTELNINARVIFNLDGGGSATYHYRGIRQNDLIDNENRAMPYYIVWSSPSAKDDGLFEAQSVVAKRLIENEKISSNDNYKDSWFADHLASEHATMRVNGSSMRIIEGRTVVMNVRFDVDATGIANYGKLFGNLPKQSASNTQFFKVMNLTDFTESPIYLEYNSSTGKSDLHARAALAEGAYGFTLVYTCEPQE